MGDKFEELKKEAERLAREEELVERDAPLIRIPKETTEEDDKK